MDSKKTLLFNPYEVLSANLASLKRYRVSPARRIRLACFCIRRATLR